MSVEIVPPTRRSCERCGRTDVWDGATENWVIEEKSGEKQVGDRHCIHEWDINGEYNPVSEESDPSDR